ncbi:Efflux transporter, RND family, MFP subunit [Candidatus Nitrospira nitrosa]|uniref:Efflux transporter, RND family, MFP subunit n=1 Tax=Candidatus Nitrospira nitrosa TaxID=1742972 RepID=A0A0S4L7W0_9BACT|nr:efflux RND transporter periplasmic adaptor subunit [Candidatus Nitrospira nitrosa]CUS33295.1 Efflux transporter, RND family, MFP subunit [Candidatus Nitrospira nitrosa]
MNKLGGKVLLILVIVGFLAILFYRINEGQHEAVALQKSAVETGITPVALTRAKVVDPSESITLPGNIVGWYEAPIYARVEGYVQAWHKDYGDIVKKGDVLAEITTPDLDAEYRQAHADLESERARNALAQLTAQRYVAMREHQALSEQAISVQLAEAQAAAAKVKAAEQKVKNIEAFIGFKKITAPFDGVVTQRNINVGDLVSKEGNLSGTDSKNNLFTVAEVDKLRLFVNVPETFGPFLASGLTANVTVPQLPSRHFNFKFLTVAKGFDVNTRTAVTVFTIDNKDRALWPGSYASVHLTAPVDRKVMTIPTSALVFQEHGTQVAVVVDEDRLHFQPITVAKIYDNFIEVSEGLSVSDRIVNNPSAALLEGDKVRVVTPVAGYDVVGTQAKAPEPTDSKH